MKENKKYIDTVAEMLIKKDVDEGGVLLYSVYNLERLQKKEDDCLLIINEIGYEFIKKVNNRCKGLNAPIINEAGEKVIPMGSIIPCTITQNTINEPLDEHKATRTEKVNNANEMWQKIYHKFALILGWENYLLNKYNEFKAMSDNNAELFNAWNNSFPDGLGADVISVYRVRSDDEYDYVTLISRKSKETSFAEYCEILSQTIRAFCFSSFGKYQTSDVSLTEKWYDEDKNLYFELRLKRL